MSALKLYFVLTAALVSAYIISTVAGSIVAAVLMRAVFG